MEMSRKMIIVFAVCNVENMVSTLHTSNLASEIVFAPFESLVDLPIWIGDFSKMCTIKSPIRV